jgi:hypothetical protein
MAYTYPVVAALGASKTGLAIGYRLLNLDRSVAQAFTTVGIAETSVPGNYVVSGGLSLAAGYAGYIEWGTAATKYAEEAIGPNSYEYLDQKVSTPPTLAATQAFNNTGQTTSIPAQVKGLDADTITAAAIATDALGSLELAAGAAAEIAAAVWGSTVRTLTTFAFDVTVGGYATGQDPGTLLDGRFDALDAGQATIAGSVAAVVDAVWAKAMTELSSVPGVNATTLEALQWLFLMARNRYEATASTQVLRNDADSATIATSASGDDGYLFTRGKWS